MPSRPSRRSSPDKLAVLLGDTVTVKLGTHVLTGIVLADGSWNVALDPAVTRTLDRGANTIFVTVTDAAGNTGAASRAITLVGVSPLITINTVSGDDIISGAEKGAPLTLTGSTQQAETGQTVTVTPAGQSFTTTVQADGSPESDGTCRRDGKSA